MKKKRMLALLLTVAMAGTMLAGCGRSDGKEDEKGKNQAKSEGKVYYLNFKPEQADDWVKLQRLTQMRLVFRWMCRQLLPGRMNPS